MPVSCGVAEPPLAAAGSTAVASRRGRLSRARPRWPPCPRAGRDRRRGAPGRRRTRRRTAISTTSSGLHPMDRACPADRRRPAGRAAGRRPARRAVAQGAPVRRRRSRCRRRRRSAGRRSVVVAEMQRAEAGAAAVRRGPAEHDELLAALAFHLQPAVAAAGTVGGVGLLADDAFQLHLAGCPAHAGGVARRGGRCSAACRARCPGLAAAACGPAGRRRAGPSRPGRADRTDRKTACRRGRRTVLPAAAESWTRRSSQRHQFAIQQGGGDVSRLTAAATAGRRSVQSWPLRVSSLTLPCRIRGQQAVAVELDLGQPAPLRGGASATEASCGTGLWNRL